MPRFTPVEFLGQGATGQVWKSLDTTNNQQVAVKMPGGDVPVGEFGRFQAAYETEALILRDLQHPGILKLIEMGQDEGRPYIAYEYLQGQSLRALLAAGKSFTPAQTGMLLVSLLDALEYLHNAGIVHRDLNPNNVMVLADQVGGMRLLDFGAAARIGAAPGPLIGTPQYMAPEQLQGGAPDPRSDLFSVGVMCYELLTGRPPFIGHSYPELVQLIGAGQFTPARQLRPELPDAVETFLRTAMAVDPVRRYQTASAMRAVLLHALSGDVEAPQAPSIAAITDDFERPTMISGTPVRLEGAALIAVDGPFKGRQFPLSGGITTLGGPYADVDLSKDLGIAAQHCWIIHEQDRFLLHDADDSGGTLLNGQSIKRAPLLTGDLIGIGESIFRFQDPHQPLGANRPPGSVEYGKPLPSDRQAAKEHAAQARIVASAQRPASDIALWLILVLLLVMVAGGAFIGTMAVASGIRTDMSLQLTPLWGKVEPVLMARSPQEFFAQAEKLDPESQRSFLITLTPRYPGFMGWLPPVQKAADEAEVMKRFMLELLTTIEEAQQQTEQTQFTAPTLSRINAARQTIEQQQFQLNPWPYNRQTALARLTRMLDFGVQPTDPTMADHPVLAAMLPFRDGLSAYVAGDWARAFNKLDEALVATDVWYRKAPQVELDAALTTELRPAGDVARVMMAVCEIRQGQIRVLQQPTDSLTPADLDTIRNWVRDADDLLRRVKVEDVQRILIGFKAGFSAGYDPRTLNDEIDAVRDRIEELRKAAATPVTPPL